MSENQQNQSKQYLIAVATPNKYIVRNTQYEAQVISEALEELGFANKILVL